MLMSPGLVVGLGQPLPAAAGSDRVCAMDVAPGAVCSDQRLGSAGVTRLRLCLAAERSSQAR